MYDVQPLASVQCRATSKRTGQRCGQIVKAGGLVCRWHGGSAPAALAAQEVRAAVAEAQVLFGGEYVQRHPGEVLVAAVADADAVLQKLKQKLELADQINAHDIDALGQWLDRVSRLSKVVLDANVDDRLAKVNEAQTQARVDEFVNKLWALVKALGHDPADPSVQAIIRAVLTGNEPPPLRRALPAADVVDLT